MKHIKIICSLTVLIGLVFTARAYSTVYEVDNEFIKISVDDNTGRFMLETIGGDPDISTDDDQILLYKKVPPTSMTTVVIDGEEFIFGSSSGSYERRSEVDGNKIVTEWSVRGVIIIQEVGIVTGPSTGREDSMRVLYKVKNDNRSEVEVGLRVMLDTYLGDTDGSGYRVPGIGDIVYETQFYREDIPEYWYSFDNFDDPNIRSQGILTGQGVSTPDRIVFASWDRLYDNLWEFEVDSTKEMKRVGTQYTDSAVALYFDELELAKDEVIMYSALYGLYGVSFISSDDLTLSLSVPAEPKRPPISVAAELQNTGETTFDSLTLELELPEGFYLNEGETNVIDFIQVEPNDTKEGLWYLQCGSIGGEFDVQINATAVLGDNEQTITATKTFTINYLEDYVISAADDVVEELEVQYTQTVEEKIAETNTNAVIVDTIPEDVPDEIPDVVEEPAVYVFSQEELDIMDEIDSLTLLIEEVDRKYQILMGIYENSYLESELIDDIADEILDYQTRLATEEEKLLNQQTTLLED